MQAWMEGYTSDVEYTLGYYREQEPDFLNLCAVMHGVAPIGLEKGFTYCELGCGQGMTVLIMASNYPQGRFYAIDFNPSHIARARRLAEEAGLTNITFLEKSFAEVDQNPSLLPECDFIVLHGIFTWVSDENRQHIINICAHHLKSGGIVYNSYNAKPGWVMGEPIQKLVYEASKLFAGNSVTRLDKSVGLLGELENAEPRFFAINKEMIKKRLEALGAKDKHYLVHEYFHDGWRAFYFTEVAAYMAQAKLDFVGEAAVSAPYVMRLLQQKTRELLGKVPDKNVRELFKDIIFNTMFRKDMFMRGIPGQFNGYERAAYLEETHWLLLKWLDPTQTEFKFSLPSLGEVQGKVETYRPLLALLRQQPCSFATLQEKSGLPMQDLLQALMFLRQEDVVGMRHGGGDIPSALSLNRLIAGQLFNAQRGGYISLPAIRGSVFLSATDTLFYLAALIVGEVGNPSALIAQAAQELEIRGMYLTHEGKNLGGDALRSRLQELEQGWRISVLPVLYGGGAFR